MGPPVFVGIVVYRVDVEDAGFVRLFFVPVDFY